MPLHLALAPTIGALDLASVVRMIHLHARSGRRRGSQRGRLALSPPPSNFVVYRLPRRAAAIRIDDIGEGVPPGSQSGEEVVIYATSVAIARGSRLGVQRRDRRRASAIIFELAKPL